MKGILEFQKAKQENRKISMVTCYDYWSARILNASQVDCILVGDSLAMVMHGHPSTVNATAEMMALHVAAVARGAPDKFIVADMPFMSFRSGAHEAVKIAGLLLQAGAHAVKLEGVRGHEEVVRHLVESGIPVMGHLGLTPQFIHQLGGFRVQGRDNEAAQAIGKDALALEGAGCFSLVLECIPAHLARNVTSQLSIPTIGIGAGHEVDGQVLVIWDLLGMNENFRPKFLKEYLNGHDLLTRALNQFDQEVKAQIFPDEQHCYT